MESGRIGYGLIGFGGMGKWHTQILEGVPQAAIAGIYDIREDGRRQAEQLGFAVYEKEEDLLSDPAVDIVLIATPNDSHKPIALRAMRAGKHVIAEKPVTLSSADLEEMINVSRQTATFLTVHQNRRWDEDFLTVREIFDKRLLGNVFRIESRVHGSRGIPGDWRREKEHGGGMVLDWGVHLFDQILCLAGERKLKTVYATLTNVTNQIVDDGFTALLRFDDGLEALIETGTNNFISLPRWYVLGENGTAVIRDWNLDGEMIQASGKDETDVMPVKTAAGLTKTMAPRRDDTICRRELPKVSGDIADFHRNVVDVLSGGAQPAVRMEQATRVMRLMEAAFRSAKERQAVAFE